MGLNWVCLGLFLGGIGIFGVKTHKIGFVLHFFVFLVDRPCRANKTPKLKKREELIWTIYS